MSTVGISAAIAASGDLILVLRILGIGLLVYLGTVYARSGISGASRLGEKESSSAKRSGFAEGALIAVINPKILAWMLAIYSPFIDSNLGVPTLLGIATIGMFIDGT